MRLFRRSLSSATAAAMTPRQVDQIARLDALRKSGALTKEEFAEQKAQVLAGGGRARWPMLLGGGMVAIGVAVAIGLWSGNEVAPPRPTPTPTVAARPTPLPSPTLAATDWPLPAAFAAATGHSESYVEPADDDDNAHTATPVRLVPLGNGTAALLVKREIKDGCHGCTGYIGVYYLKPDANGAPVLVKAWPEAVPGSSWGTGPNEWNVSTRFTTRPAVYAVGGFTGQGITESNASITELTPTGPVTSAMIGVGFDNDGAVGPDTPDDPCSVVGKIGNVIADGGFDVTYSGTRAGTDHYARQNGKFVAIGKHLDWAEPCG